MITKVIKTIVGCLVTIALAFVLIQYCGKLLDPKASEDGLDMVKAFDLLEDDSLDVIVYGPSYAWKGCDTRVMCDEYGMAAYNYACHWQSINTVLLFLEDSLRTQKPKVACIEVGLVDKIEKDVNMNGQIYYTRAMTNFDGKQKYLKQCFGDDIGRYMSYYVPLIMFHENWVEVDFENFYKAGPQRYIESRGFNPSDNVDPCEELDYLTFEQNPIPQDSIDVLDEMVSICNENGIKIVFYTAPKAEEYHFGDAMEKYAKENHCDYINFYERVDDINLDWDTDLQDYCHLNSNGAKKVASYLAEYILDNVYV